jgi:glycosyltransferase involved in cell wall biosynthesis
LRFLSGQVTFMRRRNLKVTIISSPGPLLDQFVEQEEVAAHAIPMSRKISPIEDVRSVYRVWRKLKEIRPLLVHAHTPKAGLVGMAAARIARVPGRIYHVHGLPYMTATGHRRLILRCSERVSCRLANQVFCVSRAMREELVREGLCDPDKALVLLNGSINGIDASGRFNPENISKITASKTRQQLGIPSEARVVGFVGRIVRDKGVEDLITAWRQLRDSFEDLRLLVVGPFENQDPISAEAKWALRHDDRVSLVDLTDDVVPYYSIMTLVVLPSYREGLPYVPLEAAAMKLPVVATRIPGCSEAVIDGVTGTLVPPGNPTMLASAIIRYLDDAELRQQHGFMGRQRVIEDYNQERLWEAQYKHYQHLMLGSTPDRT